MGIMEHAPSSIGARHEHEEGSDRVPREDARSQQEFEIRDERERDDEAGPP